MPFHLNSFGLSDIGVSRPNNEDVWTSLPEIGFFALADGMGGHQAGEIAAKETIESISKSAKAIKSKDCMELIIELRSAIEKANKWVHELGKKSQTLSGMGTTLCCMIWTESAIVYAHVGDSRIYRSRGKKLELLTQDHSLFAKWLATGKLAELLEQRPRGRAKLLRKVFDPAGPRRRVRDLGEMRLLKEDELRVARDAARQAVR